MRHRPARVRKAAWLVFFVVALLFPARLFAVPARAVIETLDQPDGSVISVRQFGDEWNNGHRTLDGYTIVRDQRTRFWMYAEQDPTGGLRPSPFIVGRDRPVGIRRLLRAQRASAQNGTQSQTAAQGPSAAANLGTQPLLAIFVDFTPSARVGGTAASLASKFFGASGSVKHYYEQVSYGNFSTTLAPESNVSLGGLANDGIVSVTLNYPHPNTGSTIDDRNRNVTRDALIAANAYVDFAQFDTNGNGVLSATELHIIIVVAGYERSYSSSPCGASVWGHRWGLSGPVPAPVLDGKVVGQTYSQFGEWHCASSNPPGHAATIGIMVHELGHDLGLPDLYDTDGSSEGIGNWSVMAGGSWNGTSLAGDSPAHFDPWSKYFEGWVSPTLVTTTLTNEIISQAATNADVYQFLPGTPSSGEYFLIENRQKTGYDAGLPGSGLLIWHIDASKSGNTQECYPGGSLPCTTTTHYKVALVQADNLFNLEKGSNRGDAGDPWPGSTGKTAFNDSSSPNSNLYSGSPSGVSVSGISASGPTMTATFGGADTTPPNTQITGGPLSVTNLTSADFTFTSTEPNSTFLCKLDAGTFVSCTSPKGYSNLAGGSHTFQVQATDQSGNTDQTPASYNWTIDITAADTSITSGPAGTITVSSATFNWTGSDNVTPPASLVYAYRLDPIEPSFSAFGSASSKAYTSLANGSYTFYVKARDQAGNEDATPASQSFTVSVPVTSSIQVTSPNGGESWKSSSRQTILWTSSGVAGNITIQLSRDGGATWTTLYNNISNSGSQNWKVTKPTTTRARIRVCSVQSPSVCDASNADFVIR